jgi:hypothetical protein
VGDDSRGLLFAMLVGSVRSEEGLRGERFL